MFSIFFLLYLKEWMKIILLWKPLKIYICKTQNDIQPLIHVLSSNTCPISTSQTSIPQIYVLFSNCRPILTFSNQCPMMSLTYVLTLTKKLAIDLRIWKGCRFENPVKSDRDLRECCQWMPIWVYHICVQIFQKFANEKLHRPFGTYYFR